MGVSRALDAGRCAVGVRSSRGAPQVGDAEKARSALIVVIAFGKLSLTDSLLQNFDIIFAMVGKSLQLMILTDIQNLRYAKSKMCLTSHFQLTKGFAHQVSLSNFNPNDCRHGMQKYST